MATFTNSNSLPYYKVVTYLSVEAQDYLAQTTDGTSHYAILNQLIKDTAVVPTSTKKRGNVIQLKVGQVECSIHSFCQAMSLGRKTMERIIRNFETLGIIRLHRSRLATVADMLCVSSWQMLDDSVVYNNIPLLSVDPQSGNQPKQKDVPPMANPTTKAKATSGVESKRPTDTLPSTSAAASVTTPSDNAAPQLQEENRGASTGYTSDLFSKMFDSGPTVEASRDVPKA